MQQKIPALSALALFNNFYMPDFGISVQHAGPIWQNRSASSIFSLIFPITILGL